MLRKLFLLDTVSDKAAKENDKEVMRVPEDFKVRTPLSKVNSEKLKNLYLYLMTSIEDVTCKQCDYYLIKKRTLVTLPLGIGQ